jgi:hypothetical protein
MTQEVMSSKRELMEELFRLNQEQLDAMKREAFGGFSDAERSEYEQRYERIKAVRQLLSETADCDLASDR